MKYVAENIKNCADIETMTGVWEKAIKMFDEAERLNMDKKQTLLNVIYGICKVK